MSDGKDARQGESQPARRFTRGRFSRGRGLRKTTGCLTCRKRHIKCDECKPRCGGCVKKRVECTYGSNTGGNAGASRRSRSSPVEQSPSEKPEGNAVAEDTALVNDKNAHSSPNVDHHSTGVLELNGEAERAPDPGPVATEQANSCFDEVPPEWQVERDAQQQRASIKSTMPYLGTLPFDHGTPLQSSNCTDLQHFTGLSEGSVESPTSRWLDLLIGDAVNAGEPLLDFDRDSNGLNVFGNSVVHTPVDTTGPGSPPSAAFVEVKLGAHSINTPSNSVHAYLGERLEPTHHQLREQKEIWVATEPLELQPKERILFRHFTDHVGQWMDLFEANSPFRTFVPHLAMHNVGLMNAILALSARHISFGTCKAPYALNLRLDSNDAIQFYYKALHYSQKAMQYDSYKTSLELLASSIIISSYEMLDGSSTDWNRHLKGVFGIQRSQIIHGDSSGLRQAVWWAWLCQDVWAAFREKRKPFTFWQPDLSLDQLCPLAIAARSVYNLAQVVSYCSTESAELCKDLAIRSQQANNLLQQLDQWRKSLTVEFQPLPDMSQEASPASFRRVWIQPAPFGVAMQVYYCSLILVNLHRPFSGGINEYMEQRKLLKEYAILVCGIAETLTDHASAILSSQCVFIAGMIIGDREQRMRVLDLLETTRQRTGWPGESLGHELSRFWLQFGQT